MATPPSATPAAAPRSGPGCLMALVLLPVVVVVGVVVGTVLNRPDDPAGERFVTIADGTTADGTQWRVDAVRDVEGDTCAFLYEGGQQLTGGCALTPDDASFGDETVVFGRAAKDTTSVEVVLSNGDAVVIDTVEADGIDGRFYAQVVKGDVDAERLAS